MKKVKAPECRSFHWCYKRPPPIRVGVHAERNPDEVRRGKSERESDRPSESFLSMTVQLMTMSSQAIGCGRRSQLSSRELYDTRGLEGGR